MHVSNKTNVATIADREKLYGLMPLESKYKLSRELIDKIVDLSEIVELDKEESLIPEGKCDKNVYILIDGILRKWHWDGNVEKTDYFATDGTICVSYHCYLLNQPSPNTIEACCRSRLLRISHSVFSNLLDSDYEFALYIIGNLQMQFLFFEKMYNTINGTAYDRYVSMCRHRPEIIKQVSLKTIASYLGITPTYLSRLRKKIASGIRLK